MLGQGKKPKEISFLSFIYKLWKINGIEKYYCYEELEGYKWKKQNMC
ncbi:MAG: hypothetical protein GQ533_02430 [Methanosarcinaceae archaeon]|nr:hypothetical protein [Methanosarcinaceae archaeon]